MNSSFNKLLTFKTLITASMIIVFSINFLLIERVDALSDTKQLVLDAWSLVNEGFYDPEKFEEIQWKRIRQKTLQKQIETTEEAYSAIENMLRPLEVPTQEFYAQKIMNSLNQVILEVRLMVLGSN